jgi:protease I
MSKGSVLILVGPEYEEMEVWYPKYRLEAAGYEAPLAGIGEKLYHGKYGYPCAVDGTAADFKADSLAGILAPGGWAPDKIRRAPAVLELIRQVDAMGRLVATICHGPWVLISAGIVRGRRMTSTVGIRDDVVNAGAVWVDAGVVADGNLISSRLPADLPAFGEAIVTWLDQRSGRRP